jgi:hypothetical protein
MILPIKRPIEGRRRMAMYLTCANAHRQHAAASAPPKDSANPTAAKRPGQPSGDAPATGSRQPPRDGID